MKSVSRIKIYFVAIGVCMILGAIYLAIDTSRFLDKAIAGVGEVIDFVESTSDDTTTYAPVVRFLDVNGKPHEFQSGTSSYPPAYDIGEKLVVLYLPLKPWEAKIKGFFSLWGGAAIVGFLGSVFFIIGSGMFLFGSLSGKKATYLKEHGEKVMVKFKAVELNESLTVNGRNPYRVVAERLDSESNKLYVYKSNNLWFDPTEYVKEEFLTVYIDKLKPKRYFLDLSFLPEEVG